MNTRHRQACAAKAVAFSFAALASAAVWAARPQVTAVSLAHREGAGTVRIDYDLSANAIVTVDIRTNGVSIGGANYAGALSGDVGRVVAAGSRSIVWQSRLNWPRQVIPDACLTAVVTAWPSDYPPDYMALDLTGGDKTARYYATADAVPGGVTNRQYKTTKLLMRKIHAANRTFRMGATGGDAVSDYAYPHRVTLTNDFYLGVYPVTQAQQKQVGATVPATCPACAAGEDAELCPVAGLSFADPRGHINDNDKRNIGFVGGSSAINKFMVATGCRPLDYPSEAEWEFACRAGATEALYDGTWIDADASGASANLDRLAWYAGNSGGALHEVGLKAPNAWGLYDMLGNAAECVLDWWKNDLRPFGSVAPFVCAASGDGGLGFRGGAYSSAANDCAISRRKAVWSQWHITQPEIGYRLSMPIHNLNFN